MQEFVYSGSQIHPRNFGTPRYVVNAEPDFADHPKVINGCSDLLVEVLGDAGRHARSAVGMGSLPNRMMVEIEAILLTRA
jgi:enamine deaminase RidA (YjgF/YER057c/UK114 family)